MKFNKLLGRLVSDKGCDLGLQALALLRNEGLSPSMTIIGDGPERPSLETLVSELDLSSQVSFRGSLVDGRREEASRHKIMIVPSRWSEPFGLVALEGIAAGCAIVASSQGGLPDAVGPCGLLFPNGELDAMTGAIKRLLLDTSYREQLLSHAQEHLRGFAGAVVAQQYLELFRLIVKPS
jgi:glycosyltransferase involved in cell wall biosynthesis